MITNIFYVLGFIVCYYLVKTYNKTISPKWTNQDMITGLLFSLSSWIGVVYVLALWRFESEPFRKWLDSDAKF